MRGVLALFRELTSVPTAPFFEHGLALRYEGAGRGPALVLAAHLDHPAFHLSKVTAQGAAGKLQGGLPAHLLKGAAVEAFAAGAQSNAPLAQGLVSGPETGGVYPIHWTVPPARGARPAFATLALTPMTVERGWLLSRSIDDLLGCAISLETLRQACSSRLKANVTVLLHRAEEVGFIGALDLIAQRRVDRDDTVL